MLTAAIAIICAVLIVAAREQWKDAFRLFRLQRVASGRSYRTITARLVGFPHAPQPSRASRSGQRVSHDLAISNASYALRASTDARLVGTALLLGGETEKAIEELRKAAAKTQDPRSLSDLSAALYRQAEELRSYDAALDAVVAARKAVAASPRLAPAHFNLALALEYIGLTTEAGKTFEHAASLEPDSEWATEALKRAAAFRYRRTDWPVVVRLLNAASDEQTRKNVVRENLEVARVFGEGPVLTEWADLRTAGDRDRAQRTLAVSRLIGDVLRETHNDVYLRDAVVAIDRAEARGEAAAMRMAGALITYRKGREARKVGDELRGNTLLAQAVNELAQVGSPVQHLARYYRAGALYELSRINEALQILEVVDANELETKGYRAVAARVGWSRGICLLRRGSYAEASQHFERAHAISVAIGEAELTAGLDGNAAQALESLGQSREAWSRRARALRTYSSLATGAATGKKAALLAAAANLQVAARSWERADALLDYALDSAMKVGNHALVTHVFAQRSVARFELGRIEDAQSDHGRALNRVRLLPKDGVRETVEAEINIASSAAKRATSPAAAVDYITRSIQHATSSGQSASLPRLYAERARAHELLRDVARRRADLRAGLAVVAGWGRQIDDIERRAAVSIWSEAMRRDLITLELGAGDVAAAFSHADDRYTPANLTAPLSLRAVQQALAPQAAILLFVTTRDRVIVFIIRSNSALAAKLPASAARIAAAAKNMRDADDAQFPAAATTLHEHLLTPIRKHLGGITTLGIVPDQELSGIPFNALRDGTRNTYLVEHGPVVHAPSASAAITWSQRARTPREEKLLAIGASEFDSGHYPAAAPLSEVEDEARKVARYSATARTLLGRKATADAVWRALPEASVTHYAGHIVGRGVEARLLLAPSGGRDSLSAREVGELRLDKTRVVVLAACRGSGTSEPTAVVQDMASGFLKAGVPTVIASTTDVADDSAPRTMQTLHSFLRNGGDGAEALRETVVRERRVGPQVPLSVRFLVMGGSRSLVR